MLLGTGYNLPVPCEYLEDLQKRGRKIKIENDQPRNVDEMNSSRYKVVVHEEKQTLPYTVLPHVYCFPCLSKYSRS